MKKIKLTQGKFALVDDQDFEYLNKWKWCYSSQGYAVRGKYVGRDKNIKQIRMHQLINKTPGMLVTDHINRNRLDNRRSNLRSIERGRNQWNRGTGKKNTSGYLGVCWDKLTKRWKAYIVVNYEHKNLGRFQNIEDAITARKKGEQFYYKDCQHSGALNR